MLISTRFGDTQPGASGEVPGRRAHAAHVLPRPRQRGGAIRPRGRRYFVFSKDVGGGEWLPALPLRRRDGRRHAADRRQVAQHRLGPWSHAGDRLAYTSTRRNGKDSDIYIIDPARSEDRPPAGRSAGGGWCAADWSPDDRKLLVAECISINESYLWLVDVATGERDALTPKGGKEKVVVWGRRVQRGTARGCTSPPTRTPSSSASPMSTSATGTHTLPDRRISTGTWTTSSLSRDGKHARLRHQRGRRRCSAPARRVDRAGRCPRRRCPSASISDLRWHENGRDLGFSCRSAQSSSDVYSLDVTTGKVERWTESETGGLNTATFAAPELVRWTSFDGRLDLRLPVQARRRRSAAGGR